MTKYVQVKNLTNNIVVYRVPELNVRRKFGAHEEKKIDYEELKGLYYQSGGEVLLKDFLQIKDKEIAKEFGVSEESFDHEYSWDEDKIKSVLLYEDIDVLHDALDFAPEGIIDSLISLAVELEIADVNKRNLIYECTGRNINAMINAKIQLAKAIGEKKEETQKQRRVTEEKEEDKSASSGRRVQD